MVELLRDLPTSVVLALTVALLTLLIAILKASAWFFQQWWLGRKERQGEQTKAILANTLAITRLEVQIEHLTKLLQIIPKLEKDVAHAHIKLREFSRE